jgi:hypothetical protein
MTDTEECAIGYYCPARTSTIAAADYTNYLCPAGTYGQVKNLGEAADCFTCPAGSYCTGGLDPALPCDPGYFCPPGSLVASNALVSYTFG